MIPLVFIFVLTIIIDFDSYRYKHLTPFDTIQYIYKTPFMIHKDFDSTNDSKKINSLYSQKIIYDDFLTNPKILNNIEKKLASKKTETIISDPTTNVLKISDTKKSSSLQIVSLNWKKKFF